MKNNYHTHCRYCHHAGGEVKDYIVKAIELGFEEIGMSDHAPVIEHLCELYGEEYAHFASNMSFDDVPNYIKDIQDCQNQFKGQIKIYKSFETEFLSKGLKTYQKLRSLVDYLILGVHYFEVGDKIISTYDHEAITYQTLPYYADTCIKGMESGLFKILAHPDLFMYHYHDINGHRYFDNVAKQQSIRIIEAAIKNDVYIELNANGLRGFGAYSDIKEWYYPYFAFWEIAKQYKDLKIVIGADAHSPNNLDNDNVKRVIKFAKDMGLNIIDKIKI